MDDERRGRAGAALAGLTAWLAATAAVAVTFHYLARKVLPGTPLAWLALLAGLALGGLAVSARRAPRSTLGWRHAGLTLAVLLVVHVVTVVALPAADPWAGVARLRDLAVLAVYLAALWLAGERGLALLDARIPAGAYRAALAVGLGSVAAAMAATVLVTVHGVRTWTLALFVALPFVVCGAERRRLVAALRRLPRTALRLRLGVPGSLGVAVGLLYLASALVPPAFIDPLTYHLSIPREVLAHGGLPPGDGNFFVTFPAAAAMNYLYLMALGSDWLPKLLHAVFLAMTVVVVATHLRVRAGRRVAAWATLLFAAGWTVQHGVQRANVDFYFAFFGLAAFLLLAQVALPDRRLGTLGRWPVLVGVLAGAALAGKIHGLVPVAALAPVLLVLAARRRVRWRDVAVVGLAAFAVYLPTLARNLAHSTDPLLAMIGPRLGWTPPAPPEVAARFAALGRVRDVFMTRPTPYNLLTVPFTVYRDGAFPTTTFDAFLEPLYLVGLPLAALLAWRRRSAHRAFVRLVLLYLAGFYLTWMATTPLVRYALPALPLVAFLTVLGLDATVRPPWTRSPWTGSRPPRALPRAIVLGCVAAVVVGNLLHLQRSAGAVRGVGLAVALGYLEPRELWLRTPAASMLLAEEAMRDGDRANPAAPRGVFMVFASQTYLHRRPYVHDPFYVNLGLLRDAERAGRDPLDELRARGHGWVLFERSRLPWLFGRRHRNPHLNPYREGLDAIADDLAWWHATLEPRLVRVAEPAGSVLYRVPPPAPDGAATRSE